MSNYECSYELDEDVQTQYSFSMHYLYVDLIDSFITVCDELDDRSAREIVIFALFGFFTQQIVPFIHKTHVYIEETDNE